MLTENGNIVVPTVAATPAEDYNLLRNAGLSYIQQFSGAIWTDYNVHDPGVTIFELLCYALTDLAYRTSLPVADLLTEPGEKGPRENNFYTARKILSTHPVTINDYRKLILDRIPGVRNIWLVKRDQLTYSPKIYFDKVTAQHSLTPPIAGHAFELLMLKGLYTVKLEVEDFETILGQHPHYLKTLAQNRSDNNVNTSELAIKEEYRECLTNYVRKTLLDSRNLAEDFEDIKIAEVEHVAACMDIELHSDANADEVYLEIFSVLQNYINPTLQFYSYAELIAKGKRTEDIFNCPSTLRGFIDDEELEKHGHREVLYVSDLINQLMDIPGVMQVKKLSLSSYLQQGNGNKTVLQHAKNFCLHLQDPVNRVFQLIMDVAEQDNAKIANRIRFSKGPIYFAPQRKATYASLDFIAYPSLPKDFSNDLPIPAGRNRTLTSYQSIQNEFPHCYYLGKDGIPNSESSLRKAQRLQTKGFLLFFDQILADYLAQLNNLKNMYASTGGVFASSLASLPISSSEIKDLRLLLSSGLPNDANLADAAYFQQYTARYNDIIEWPAKQKERRSKALDHLLARFNERFVDYSVFKFQQNKNGNFFTSPADAETINDKIQFLNVYPIISGKRSHAFNYTKSFTTGNISGLQLRLLKMMGVSSSTNKNLVKPINKVNYKWLLQSMVAKVKPKEAQKLQLLDNRFADFDTQFGLHIMEHILLRPLHGKSTQGLTQLLRPCGDVDMLSSKTCVLADNYSHQITVVLPGWLSISTSTDFRKFTEALIRQETPAHLLVKICWLDPATMFLFESCTAELYKHMALIKKPGAMVSNTTYSNYNIALNEVYQMMGLLKNMYLPSALNECQTINYNEETASIKVPVILNHAALGSDGTDEWFTFKSKIQTPLNPIILTDVVVTDRVRRSAVPAGKATASGAKKSAKKAATKKTTQKPATKKTVSAKKPTKKTASTPAAESAAKKKTVATKKVATKKTTPKKPRK